MLAPSLTLQLDRLSKKQKMLTDLCREAREVTLSLLVGPVAEAPVGGFSLVNHDIQAGTYPDLCRDVSAGPGQGLQMGILVVRRPTTFGLFHSDRGVTSWDSHCLRLLCTEIF